MVTQSCGAHSVILEESHALEDEAVVRIRRCRSSRTHLMVTRSYGAHSVIPEQSHALEDEAVVRTLRCRSSRMCLMVTRSCHTCSVELLCTPDVDVAVVRAR